jgi:hypothetical protein
MVLSFVFKADSIFFEKYLFLKRGLCKVIEVFCNYRIIDLYRVIQPGFFPVCHGIYWQYLFRQLIDMSICNDDFMMESSANVKRVCRKEREK